MRSKKRTPRRGKRSAAKLTSLLNQRLFAYAVAAAGTAVLAPPANASIVFTKTDITLTNGFLDLDLNHDGTADFTLHNFSFGGTSYRDRVIEIKGNVNDSAAGVIVQLANDHEAYPLPLNYAIGSGITKSFRFQSVFIPSGAHYRIQDKFLGLRFTINGELHYGWARFSSRGTYSTHLTLKLTGFAYETQPNTAILAGDRGSASVADADTTHTPTQPYLGLLSLGSAGIDVWRSSKWSDARSAKGGE